jgi:hypothetical protein
MRKKKPSSLDKLLLPFVYPAAVVLRKVRKIGLDRMPLCKAALLGAGVLPVRDHYYEPLIDARRLAKSLREDRPLPGIDWNVNEQLGLLRSFSFQKELQATPLAKQDDFTFHFNNGAFESGDAEFLYNLIRLKKPARLFEIGSGHSTRLAIQAIRKNTSESPGYRCKHVCVEPYEHPWLEKSGVTVVREKVERLGTDFFRELTQGDILFIDSSHIIRPQGDVLFEYLELLPSLAKGVIVHVHDIFSPRDYLDEWVKDQVLLWNEQYLLEAFLTSNRDWKIIGALNYLHHNHADALKAAAPFVTPDREPGSFYLQRN